VVTSASTVVNGRQLFNDSRGSTSTGGDGGGVSVGAVTSSGVRFNTDRRSVTVKGGNQEQVDKIWTAVSKARVMLDTAMSALNGVDSLPEKAMAALEANFHNVDRSSYPTRVSHLYDIRESFATTRRAFDGDIPVEVEDEPDGNTEGYVRDWWLWKSDIHLHPLWFSQGLTERARIVVHEACRSRRRRGLSVRIRSSVQKTSESDASRTGNRSSAPASSRGAGDRRYRSLVHSAGRAAWRTRRRMRASCTNDVIRWR
jgi:hypothetical protein